MTFTKKNLFSNFGDLGISVKQLVDQFAAQTKSNQNIQSLDQIKEFINKYPEFKKLSGNVSKHVSLISDLSKIVASRKLMDVSETEQELACNNSHSSAFEKVMEAIQNPSVSDKDKVKLVMLYNLRYETSTSNSTSQLISELIKANVDRELTGLISRAISYAGSQFRSGDLFDNKNVFKNFTKSVFRGIQGVENIYTQHKPALFSILENLTKGKLNEQEYPFLQRPVAQVPSHIIVFIYGGITYQEVKTIHEFNINNPSFSFILGGTTIHNSQSFLDELKRFQI